MRFQINKKKYGIAVSWINITLNQSIEIGKLDVDEDLLSRDEYSQAEIEYCRKVLSILSNCPIEVLEQTQDTYIVVLFNAVKDIVRDLYHFKLGSYAFMGIGEIRFKGKKYFMPETLDLKDNPILAYKESSKNICEAADMMKVLSEMKSKGLESMKYVCAIYLKEKGESNYDEKEIAERAKIFGELPMYIVWDVFFFIYHSLCSFALDTAFFSEKPNKFKGLIMAIPLIVIGCIMLLIRASRAAYKKSKKHLSGTYAKSLNFWHEKLISKKAR